MSAWSPIRRFTDADLVLLNKRALEFAERHNISVDSDWEIYGPPYYQVSELVENDTRLKHLFRRVFQRATKTNGNGVAYGYIGYPV